MVGEHPHGRPCKDDEGDPVDLPGDLGLVPCLRHVRSPQACAEAALRVQAACAPVLAPSARRRDAAGLQERDELALGLRIPLDIALRHGQAGMAGELLHVPETAPDLGDSARSPRNEGAASRVRRTAVHLERGREAMELQAHSCR